MTTETTTTEETMTTTTTYAVDDEFGNQITCGLESYDRAEQTARKYLSAHKDAPSVTIYEDAAGGERWVVTLADL